MATISSHAAFKLIDFMRSSLRAISFKKAILSHVVPLEPPPLRYLNDNSFNGSLPDGLSSLTNVENL